MIIVSWSSGSGEFIFYAQSMVDCHGSINIQAKLNHKGYSWLFMVVHGYYG